LGIDALTTPTTDGEILETSLEFPDNRLLVDLCGEFDRNLAQIEHGLGLQILRRGNHLSLIGDVDARSRGASLLQGLYERLEAGRAVEPADIDAAMRLADTEA